MATKKAVTKKVTKETVLKADVYSIGGKKGKNIDLPEAIFGLPWNESLVYQVTTAMQANARTPVAHVRTRGEVRGGGKKPWKQKGTGRARHGSSRSPIWVGGGVTHGPRNDKNYTQKVNKKARTKALFVTLSEKLRDGSMLFVDAIDFSAPKTKEAKAALANLAKVDGFASIATKKQNSTLIALPEVTPATAKSFRNMGNVAVLAVKDLNPVEVLRYKHVIMANPEASCAILSERAAKKTPKKA